ncbi:MAG TPA: O-antigen ligase family protein [Steroidobacteraceae bacterium]|nr:O-antigen ligase family protein [Steroidobacteraceae bacterium]
MLTAFKDMLHGIMPWVMYLAIFFTIGAAAFKRAPWGLLLLILLIPQPNIWYKIHALPLGTSTMDLLLLATIAGIFINNGGWDAAPRTLLITMFLLMLYAALWNTTLRFNFPIPLTTANRFVPDFKNYVEMIILYFLAYNSMKTEEDQKRAVALMAFVLFFICLREIRNFSAGAAFSYDKRAAGPFWMVGLGANHFGSYIAYVGSFILGVFMFDKEKKWRRLLYAAALYCCVYPLFMTYSRGAYAAVIIALLVFGVFHKRMILVGIAILGFTWTTVLPSTVVERITMTETAEGQIEESAAIRLVLWEKAEELFQRNPVFGIGYQAFSVSVRIGGLNNVHNFYMQTAAEQGVIGLIFLALLILYSGFTGLRLFRSGVTPFQKGMGLGFMGAVAAIMISNVFGDRWSYFALGSMYWIMWGLVDRALYNARNPPPVPEPVVAPPDGALPDSAPPDPALPAPAPSYR